MAAMSGHTATVEYLIAHGAEVNAKDVVSIIYITVSIVIYYYIS